MGWMRKLVVVMMITMMIGLRHDNGSDFFLPVAGLTVVRIEKG